MASSRSIFGRSRNGPTESPTTEQYLKNNNKIAEITLLHKQVQEHPKYAETVEESVTKIRDRNLRQAKDRNEKLLKAEQSTSIFGARKAQSKNKAESTELTDELAVLEYELKSTRERLLSLDQSSSLRSFDFEHGRIEYDNSQSGIRGGYALILQATFFPKERTTASSVVAMKLMSQNTSGLEERLKRATKEARIWEQLQHSNVAEFFYTIPMPETLLDQIVVVSPWSDGCGTGNATASSFLLDPANIEATPMIIQGIIAGLEYMHDPTTKPAVFHGDLKGNNILIFGTREAPIPRITDFGLSKMEAPDSSAPSVVIGAAHWAAPELFGTGDSSTVISAQSDVWSLGATIFELVTGRPLFHDKQFIAVVCFYVLETRRHREQEVADYLMCLPDPVRQVVHRIFVEDIAVRPTATDVSIMWETLRTQVQIHDHSWRSLMTTVQAPHFLHNRVTNPDGGRVLSNGEWATWMTNQREQRG